MACRIAVALVGALVWLSGIPGAGASGVTVTATRDLMQTAQEAHERRVPMMLVFASEGCPYCDLLEEDFLEPMIISGDYERKVLIRKIQMESGRITDFSGTRVSIREFADRYGISVTPTIVFLDRHGTELTDKMVGIRTPDFFGGYLDESIDLALGEYREGREMTAGPCPPQRVIC